MRNANGKPENTRPNAKYWLCRCNSCAVVYGLIRSGVRSLQEDIGKAKCPECGTLLVRSKRTKDTPVCFITRKDARLS